MKNALFILTILLIPIGILLKLYDLVGGNILLTLGFFGLLIFHIKRTISAFQAKVSKKNHCLEFANSTNVLLLIYKVFVSYFR